MILVKRFVSNKEGIKGLAISLSALPKANINFKRKTNFEEVIDDFDKNKTFDQQMKDRLAQSFSKEDRDGAQEGMNEALDFLKKELNSG